MIDHFPELAADPRQRHRLLASIALASLAHRELESSEQERPWWARCSLLAAGALLGIRADLDFEGKQRWLDALLDFDALSHRGSKPFDNPRLAQYLNSIPGFESMDALGQGSSQRDHHAYFQAALRPILSESIDALFELEPHIAQVGCAIARQSAKEVSKACKAYEVRLQISSGAAQPIREGAHDGAKSL